MAASGTSGGQPRVTSTTAERGDRRHPPRREHAPVAGPARSDDRRSFASTGALGRSLYLRFHGHLTIDERLVDPVLDPDWLDRGALLGSVVESRRRARRRARQLRAPARSHGGGGRVHGGGCVPGPRHRDTSRRAARRARGRPGIERFVGEVIADNSAMIGVFERVGFEVSRTLGGGEVEMTFPIAPTVDYASLVAERDHTAVVASLRPFFEARSVAVIGASSRRGTIGGELFRNILDGDYEGAAYPVNRTASPSQGCVATARSRTSRIESTSPWFASRRPASSTPCDQPSSRVRLSA